MVVGELVCVLCSKFAGTALRKPARNLPRDNHNSVTPQTLPHWIHS